jgi:hypothetical protein
MRWIVDQTPFTFWNKYEVRKLSQSKRKLLQTVITYFENHKHMMDYAAYLEKGYPITTGLVERCINRPMKC